MTAHALDPRAGVPRPIALVIVGAIVGATLLALFWPSLPVDQARHVVGSTKVDVVTRQIDNGGSGRINDLAPDFEWVAPDGRTVRLSSLRGRAVVMNFWATWCIPCRSEMPLLEKAAAASPGTTYLAVDLDEDGDKIRAFFDEIGVRSLEPVLDVGLATSRRYGLASVPSTFFIDTSGTIRHVQIGEMDQDKLQRGLDRVR